MSGTTQANWWDSAPLVQPAATGDKWWESAPLVGPQELSPIMGGIVDDPARAAPARVIANASLFPNAQDRIPVYAKALGIPPEKFALSEGNIVYQDPQNPNQFVRVEPSVTGATGPADLLRRGGLYAAGSVGPAIPAVAGIAAGAATMNPVGAIAGAGAGAAAGDTVRQLLGNYLNGRDLTNIDAANVGGQAALGMLGQGMSVAGRAMFDRVPPGLARADRAWMRDPANVAQAQANAELLRRQGLTAMNGPVTNRGSLIAADRQLMRNPETADQLRAAVTRLNTEEVPRAATRAADRIAPDPGVDVAARNLRTAAEPVIEAPRVAANAAATPYYQTAERGAQTWTPELAQLMDQSPAVQAAMKRARVTYQNKFGAPPETPDFRLWDLTKKELDAAYSAAESAMNPAERASLSGIDAARRRVVGALEDLYPTYAQGKAVAQPGMQASATLRDGMLGDIAGQGADTPAQRVLGKAFSTTSTSPTAIAETRQAFEKAGRLADWETAFSAHVRSVADQAQRTLANGDTGNVAGKIHAELFGTSAKRDAVAAALGGRGTPAYKQFAETMRSFEIAARVPAIGSPTASDMGRTGAVASPTASTVASGFRLASPSTWLNLPNKIADAIEGRSAGQAAQRTAAQYAAGPAANGIGLSAVRVMSPATYGLLSGLSRGAAGLLPGLMQTAAPPPDWQPYQQPLPRR